MLSWAGNLYSLQVLSPNWIYKEIQENKSNHPSVFENALKALVQEFNMKTNIIKKGVSEHKKLCLKAILEYTEMI